uniref:Putative secreted protein n=1 Tax=Ixodes ricinus TaxID=34613 RepID=A0A6B0U6H2_IXORI
MKPLVLSRFSSCFFLSSASATTSSMSATLLSTAAFSFWAVSFSSSICFRALWYSLGNTLTKSLADSGHLESREAATADPVTS